ncbi:MAG: LVIVD repeat-containing protein, partial [Promethearchaeota archaeon]
MKKRNLVFFIQIACIIVAPLFLCENQNSQNDSILATVKAQNGQQETFYPHLIGKKNLGIIYDIFVAENYAYVTNNDALVIVDIHNLARPKKISVIEVEGGVFGVSVRNDLAYIATDDSHEFLIADVSDPANPTIIGSYQANDELRRVELDGNFAYVVSFNEGLLIFNIQDPTNPTLVGQFNDGGQGTSVAISGDIAFFTDISDGLEVLDISNKSSPHEIATFIEYYGAFDVEIHGDVLYMAC